MSAELRQIPSEPLGEEIAEMVATLAERAERGDFSSIAIAYVTREGAIGSAWTSPHTLGTLIGAISVLHHRLCEKGSP